MELIFLFFADYPILGNEKSLPLYLQNMGHHHCQDHLIRPEGYHYDQILYCTKGSGTLIFENKAISIPHDTAIFIPAETPHEYYPEEDIWDIHWIVPADMPPRISLPSSALPSLKPFTSATRKCSSIFSAKCTMLCEPTAFSAITKPLAICMIFLWSFTASSPTKTLPRQYPPPL